MLDELNRHKIAYAILFLLLFIHVGLFLIQWPNQTSMRIVAASLATTYFCWGVFAHVKAQHINSQIVKEYFFTSLLAGSMLFFLTW